ncbi:MAG: response regulator [bacterium]|nr:response regulator [bacterium]
MTGKTILYIEDDPGSRRLVRKILERDGFLVHDAENGFEGIDLAQTIFPDLIIMDMGIPGMDGYETTTRLRGMPGLKNIPIVALTGRASEGDRERSLIAGCNGLLTKPIIVKEFSRKIRDYLSGLREQIDPLKGNSYLKEYSQHLAARLDQMSRQMHEYNQQMNSVCGGILGSMMNALREKDPYTYGHSSRVTHFATAIGRQMALSTEDLDTLTRAGLLHDVGKVVIDLSSINKPGRLSKREWSRMKKHPTIGSSILAPLCFLHREISIVAHHHERWDGAGYPDGLSGSAVSLLTYVIAAADSYDAMTSARCYREKILAGEEVIHEFRRCRESQFHPEVADTLIALIEEEELAIGESTGLTDMIPVVA